MSATGPLVIAVASVAVQNSTTHRRGERLVFQRSNCSMAAHTAAVSSIVTRASVRATCMRR